ncbi:MAG TPA: TlpA disulfide reductase family protein [Rhodocyclaceae bacterium]|nr:TlpA disulfide reductase family protein [Rhodocyclaceae bacterium]
MNLPRWSLRLLAAALALGFACGGFWLGMQWREGTPDAQAARQLMTMTLPDQAGDAHSLTQWQGKVLVVNFWASWCAPCREEMPGFARLQSKYAANGVQFVGIAFDSHAAVTEFIRQTPVNYPTLIGGGEVRDLMKALGNAPAALPFTVILDVRGKPIQSRLGRYEEADLDAKLQGILQR